jgi:hypothetical protein
MLWRASILAAALLALTPVAARATTYYAVAHGATSGTECPLGAECALPHALSLTKDGDSVVLEPGPEYTPPSTLVVKHAIDIGGAPGPARPTIRGAEEEAPIQLRNPGSHIHDVDLVAFEAFAALEIDEGSAERVLAAGEDPATTACQIFDATLVDVVCRSPDIALAMDGGGAVSYSSTLRNVTALSAGRAGIVVYAPGQFHENRLEAVNVIARGGPGAPDVSALGGAGEGAAVVHLTSSDYATTEVFGPESLITPAGTNGNIAAPPQFVNQADGDLHELATSPTIDAGSTDSSVASTDLDGNPRALTAHPTCGGSLAGPTDIGAYEFVPPAPTCAPPPPQESQKSAPPPPGTVLKKVKIDQAAGTATFTFAGSGAVSGFACELLRPVPKGAKKSKRRKSAFVGCRSPKTYRHLNPGRYTFEVEASGPGGTDPTPAKREIAIRG